MQVRGASMLPTLWPGDIVEIKSCFVADVLPGEVVLAFSEGRFYLHRFVAGRADGFLLRGDSMPASDEIYPNEALLGRLMGRNTDSSSVLRSVHPLRPWSRAIGWLLCHCDFARRIVLRLHVTRPQSQSNLHAHEAACVDLGVS
jgi:hypothetical protein